MSKRIISFDGGLVTARPAALLGEGDLARARGIEYRPGSPSPRKLEGFQAFEVVGGIGGYFIGQVRFANGEHYVVYATLLSEAGGVYTSITRRIVPSGIRITDTTPDNIHKLVTQIDLVYFDDEYFMLFGGNSDRSTAGNKRNFVLTARSTSGRYHGMLPNVKAPSTSLIPSVVGLFTIPSATTGYTLTKGAKIEYWVEERVKDADGNILRRNIGSSKTVLKVVGDNVQFGPVIVYRPEVVNSDATHWALYGTATGAVYPSGFQIDEVPITEGATLDTRTGTDPTAPMGSAYPVLTANVNGVILTVPKFGTVPLCNIGESFEGSLVCDDPDVPGLLRFSLAGGFDHFPAFNGIQVGETEGERITMIKRLGRGLIVGTDLALYRIATLPRADQDAGFNLDRVKETIEEGYSVISQRAAVRYQAPGGPQLAYLTSSGLRSTDGVDTVLLSTNLDWPATVERSELGSAFLLNNSEKQRLELYYAEAGSVPAVIDVSTPDVSTSAFPSHSLHFYYDRSQVRSDGMPKITGPHPVKALSGCVVQEGTRRRVYLTTIVTTGSTPPTSAIVKADGGNAYLHRFTSSDIDVDVASGEIYPAGVGNASVLREIALHHGAGATAQTVTLERTARNEGRDDQTVGDAVTLERAGLSSASTLAYGSAEAFQFAVTNEDSLGEFDINFVVADFEPTEDRGGFSKAG